MKCVRRSKRILNKIYFPINRISALSITSFADQDGMKSQIGQFYYDQPQNYR